MSKSPVEVVDDMIRRKNGTKARLMSAGVSLTHPQDAAMRALRMAETLAVIEALEEVREELVALAEEVEPEVLGVHMAPCRYSDLPLTEDYLTVIDCCCEHLILAAKKEH